MTTYYNENDPKAVLWLRELIAEGLIPAGHVDDRSICDVKPEDLEGFTQCHFFAGIGGWALALRLAGWPDDEEVWTASCPCQPFSGAGKNEGLLDERHLWPVVRRLIAECGPAITFGEQVASAAGRLWLAGVRTDLEGMGNAVGCADLCAAGIGQNHIRQRLYWASDTNVERLQKQRKRRKNTSHNAPYEIKKADRLVDAVRRGNLPFLCREHDGVPVQLARCAAKGFGNAIHPQLAAEFICAYLEVTV